MADFRSLLSKKTAFAPGWAGLMGLYFYAWTTRWTWDPAVRGSLWPGRFFSAQAEAMLRGRLWVDPVDLPGECFVVGTRCYGYFGIVPSLIRAPFLWFVGPGMLDYGAAFMAVAVGIAVWAGVDLFQRVLGEVAGLTPGHHRIATGLFALITGPASVLILLADPYIYQEAILWGLTGAVVATNVLWRWTREKRHWQLIVAAAALAVSSGSRPTTLTVGLVVALGLAWSHGSDLTGNRRALRVVVAVGLLPILLTFGVFVAKFGQVLPSYDTYQQSPNQYMRDINDLNDGQMSGLRFAPTSMFAYTRPDSVKVSTEWPWFRFRFGVGSDLDPLTYLPPLKPGSMYVEPTASITTVMPLASIATAGSIAYFVRDWRRRKKIRFELVLLAALSTAPLVTSLNYGITTRYLGDFYPLLVAGSAFSCLLIPHFLRWPRQIRYAIGVLAGVSIIVSLVMIPTLTTQYGWIWRFGIFNG